MVVNYSVGRAVRAFFARFEGFVHLWRARHALHGSMRTAAYFIQIEAGRLARLGS